MTPPLHALVSATYAPSSRCPSPLIPFVGTRMTWLAVAPRPVEINMMLPGFPWIHIVGQDHPHPSARDYQLVGGGDGATLTRVGNVPRMPGEWASGRDVVGVKMITPPH